MKLNKKKILSVLAVLCLGLAVSMPSFRAGGVSSFGDGAATVDLSVDPSAGTVKTMNGSGDVEVDFAALKERNQDIYAWVTVPGTRVDYPVLQKSDAKDPYDNYYLDHTADLEEGLPGAVYTQPVNQKDFMDPVTVLYGHNMKNGGMFSSLHEFEGSGFFEGNSQVVIYTPDGTLDYEIFAAVEFSDALLPYEYDFTQASEVQRYLGDVRGCQGNFREGVTVSEGDKVLTLSTCYSDKEESRLLIVAVLKEGLETE